MEDVLECALEVTDFKAFYEWATCKEWDDATSKMSDCIRPLEYCFGGNWAGPDEHGFLDISGSVNLDGFDFDEMSAFCNGTVTLLSENLQMHRAVLNDGKHFDEKPSKIIWPSDERDVFYSERWLKDDLEGALIDNGINPTEENIKKLEKNVIPVFDDKSYRNEQIQLLVEFTFKERELEER